VALGKPQVLFGCWPDTCHMSLSRRQLTIWHLVSLRPGKQKSKRDIQVKVVLLLIPEVNPFAPATPYSREMSH